MKKILPLIALFCVLWTQVSAQSQTRYQPTWESLKDFKVAEWVQDAIFGVFIHWGVYSVPAYGNEWYPRYMYYKESKEYQHQILAIL